VSGEDILEEAAFEVIVTSLTGCTSSTDGGDAERLGKQLSEFMAVLGW
jgi:hypothetical protein